jgi:hypothetical protein
MGLIAGVPPWAPGLTPIRAVDVRRRHRGHTGDRAYATAPSASSKGTYGSPVASATGA